MNIAENVIVVLIALLISAGLIYQYYLLKINAYLKLNHPDEWTKHGFGNHQLNLLARLNRLRDFSVKYTSNDQELESMLNSTSTIHKAVILMLVLVMVWVSYVIVNQTIA